MANIAVQDQKKRSVVVDRRVLLETLLTNREKHIAAYNEAMSGYKEVALHRLDTAFANGAQSLQLWHSRLAAAIRGFTAEDIAKQRDYFEPPDRVIVKMPVPRSYEAEYNAAIDMLSWDTRDQVELTYAEFTCFVRDMWDWKSEFDDVLSNYK